MSKGISYSFGYLFDVAVYISNLSAASFRIDILSLNSLSFKPSILDIRLI